MFPYSLHIPLEFLYSAHISQPRMLQKPQHCTVLLQRARTCDRAYYGILAEMNKRSYGWGESAIQKSNFTWNTDICEATWLKSLRVLCCIVIDETIPQQLSNKLCSLCTDIIYFDILNKAQGLNWTLAKTRNKYLGVPPTNSTIPCRVLLSLQYMQKKNGGTSFFSDLCSRKGLQLPAVFLASTYLGCLGGACGQSYMWQLYLSLNCLETMLWINIEVITVRVFHHT